MPEMSETHRELLLRVKESGAIDFEKLGQVVTEVTPQLFDPGVIADDYVASAYSSVAKVWKMDVLHTALEQIGSLQKITTSEIPGRQ
ncbi:hypothetical protein [Frankia sp. AgB32]|uniref:hypothetical protein n=1 Tax=Frankia sp. AgB32 TaxID=631119 RepID=UPI00200FD59D|nr:hypothetical protein [Frankia sp. AgB32]MCK9894184.1 hypothetical protein [Frankia sp. AgB32]